MQLSTQSSAFLLNRFRSMNNCYPFALIPLLPRALFVFNSFWSSCRRCECFSFRSMATSSCRSRFSWHLRGRPQPNGDTATWHWAQIRQWSHAASTRSRCAANQVLHVSAKISDRQIAKAIHLKNLQMVAGTSNGRAPAWHV